MKKALMALMGVFAAICIAGCDNMSKQDADTLNGAATDTSSMSRLSAGIINNSQMDETDRNQFNNAFENNAIGQASSWRNRHTGVSYEVVPVDNITFNGNPYCREYRASVIANGKHQNVCGTACRARDGSWKIVKSKLM